MPHHLVNSRIGEPLLVLDKVDSTNNYAMGQVHAGLASHGYAYFTHHQFAGKGQRGKTWISEPGENIALSIVLNTSYAKNQNPFLLSAAIALGTFDLLLDLLKTDVSIKWPNDLYWCDRKTGGILIENIYHGNEWKYAVAGIGINVNQTSFPDGINAVSIKQVTGENFNTLKLASRLCAKIEYRYLMLFEGKEQELLDQYNEHLYKRGESIRIRKNNAVFETVVDHVSSHGQLITKDSIERRFDFGEIEWII